MEVVIEDFMEGEEASYFICTDGQDFVSFPSAQDHKRIGEGDTGPNTGGMGAYSPAPIFTKEVKQQVDEKIIKPTLKALQDMGEPYKGILYAGLMINNGNAKLVEYNVRFGDPECQVLMLRIKSDIVEMMLNSIHEKIKETQLDWGNDHCATVVMASKGYPGDFEKKTVIKKLNKLNNNDNFQIFHASTILEDQKVKSNGGRVLSVTAKSKILKDALRDIYQSINLIDWPQSYYRKDIGFKALKK
jgi:phosphoribosylamine--glycine ligase